MKCSSCKTLYILSARYVDQSARALFSANQMTTYPIMPWLLKHQNGQQSAYCTVVALLVLTELDAHTITYCYMTAWPLTLLLLTFYNSGMQIMHGHDPDLWNIKTASALPVIFTRGASLPSWSILKLTVVQLEAHITQINTELLLQLPNIGIKINYFEISWHWNTERDSQTNLQKTVKVNKLQLKLLDTSL